MERHIINAAGAEIEEESVREFEEALLGRILCPGDDGYDQARRTWNASVDKRPAVIVRCQGASDVTDALNFARDNELEIAVRSGGHNVAGNAVCDGGMVIDLSAMKAIHVEPRRRTLRAEAGCTWGELDHATQAFGMATPGGVVSTTGIAGLTLGGGVGWLVRRRGLTCDNVLSIDLLTADGRMLTASADQNEELFWGLRGGGGNFGIATSFEYTLHDQGPVLGGMLVHPRSRAPELLRFYRSFMAEAPWELTAYAALVASPGGDPLVALILCYSGDDLDEGEALLRPLREFGPPLEDNVARMPYVEMQCLLNPAFPSGNHHYWKSSFLRELTDGAIDALVDGASGASPLTAVVLEYYGGRASLPDTDATAFPHRRARYDLGILAQWTDPAESRRQIEWTRGLWNAMQRFASGDVHFNFLNDDGEAGIRSAFGANYQRLVALKRKYDPNNLFHLNHNIKP